MLNTLGIYKLQKLLYLYGDTINKVFIYLKLYGIIWTNYSNTNYFSDFNNTIDCSVF